MTKKKILIIDDMKEFCQMIERFLNESNEYDVRYETSGRLGIARVKQWKPDLVFLDVMLEDIAGGEVARQLKDGVDTHHIPIIFLTGTVTKEEAQLAHGSIGGCQFLAKPVSQEEILRCVQEWTEK